jgi:cephalosporin-C deacetylase-like acetyl esterase
MFRCFVSALLLGGLVSGAVAAEPAAALWDLDALRKMPAVTWEDAGGPLRKLYYESEPRDGKPTRVFAYCAFPERQEGKAPGVVLIHGGGGTAFPEWATVWAKRGYVAIAMDLAGRGPERMPLPDGGPDQVDTFKFPKTAIPLKDMWSYHAVAAAIRGASVLASLPEVDADRLAVTGISWGGYLTCIVAGLDDRFKAAVPVYGCGYLNENSAWLSRFAEMEADWKETWIRHFDPSQHVGRAKMPMLFVNGTNDFAYPLDSYQKTYRLVKDRALCVTVNMPHGHPQGWAPQEIGIFIDQHVTQGTPLPTIGRTVDISKDAKSAAVSFRHAKPKRAKFHWTTDEGAWQKRTWHSRDAQIAGNDIRAELPAERPLTAFITLTDERDATVSTEHFVLP